jgi:hypothetical protein
VRGKKRQNVFYDDGGYPDQSHDFDVLLHNIDGGTILQKRKHPAPPLDDIDPRFFAVYDQGKLSICRISTQVCNIKFIASSRNTGWLSWQFVPVKDYECVINTGTARPICVKKIQYGPRKTPIM